MKHLDPDLPVSTPIERDNSKRFKSDEQEEQKVNQSPPSNSKEEDYFEMPELGDSTTELKYLRGKLMKMSECFIEYAEKSVEVHEYLKSKHLAESDQNKHNITLLEIVYNEF